MSSIDEYSERSRRGEVCGVIGCKEKPTTQCIGELYSGFIIREEAQRAINSKGSKRTGHKEAKSVLNK